MSVGITNDGNIDAPKNVNDAGWYDGSAKPGQDGAVFIDGHTSFSSSFKAVFNDLPKLKEGDKIIIERGDGKKFTYTVAKNENVARTDVDMKKALSSYGDSKQSLTLMTCTGKYDYQARTADSRGIIYATLDEE
jgi:LPXTG-site transpeptidase (sortase) family protein